MTGNHCSRVLTILLPLVVMPLHCTVDQCKAREEFVEVHLGGGKTYTVKTQRCVGQGRQAPNVRCVAVGNGTLLFNINNHAIATLPYNHTECEMKRVCVNGSKVHPSANGIVDFACPYEFEFTDGCVCREKISKHLMGCKTKVCDCGQTEPDGQVIVSVKVLVLSLFGEFLVILGVYCVYLSVYLCRHGIFGKEVTRQMISYVSQMSRQLSTAIGFGLNFNPNLLEGRESLTNESNEIDE